MKLTDKVVLITDGESEIGTAIANHFKSEGGIIVINTPSKKVDPSCKYDMTVSALSFSKKEIDNAVREILEKYGRVDVLVHNNNEITKSSLETASDEEFLKTLNTNTKSAFLFVQAVAPSMQERKKGNIVFISSIHDEKPNGGAFAYSLSKGAIKNLAREMVIDLGRWDIRTNVVNVGPMKGSSEMFYSDLSALYELPEERIVNKKYCTLKDISNAALFFASDDSLACNGSELKLDSGFLLTFFRKKLNRDESMLDKPGWESLK